jgi:hypothetical protein
MTGSDPGETLATQVFTVRSDWHRQKPLEHLDVFQTLCQVFLLA